MPVDNKKHEYVISDAVYGSYDLDHIIIKIDAFENGSWKTKGTAVEYRPLEARSHHCGSLHPWSWVQRSAILAAVTATAHLVRAASM
jgi:hypothetical protein